MTCQCDYTDSFCPEHNGTGCETTTKEKAMATTFSIKASPFSAEHAARKSEIRAITSRIDSVGRDETDEERKELDRLGSLESEMFGRYRQWKKIQKSGN